MYDRALVGVAGEQLYKITVVFQVLVVGSKTIGAGGVEHDVVVAVFRHVAVMVVARIFVIAEDQLVRTLRGTQLVVVYAMVLVVARKLFPFLRGRITAIEETIARPACAAEFHPLQAIFQLLLSGYFHHANLAPIASCFRNGQRYVAVILRKTKQTNSGGPIFRPSVGVDKNLRIAIQTFLEVDDRLVL